jgi:NADH dehydrogenase (ubiquinone) 1 beta subcomplex subunit 10
MSDSHGGDKAHGHSGHHETKKSNIDPSKLSYGNPAIEWVLSLGKIFDGPATFFKEKVTTPQNYPYYHRKYNRVPDIDQCSQDDFVCIHEANEQFYRDRKVDKNITKILGDRAKECYYREGQFDGATRCRQLDDEHERAVTNYYIKYGDLSAAAGAKEAYMKQKHRLIWQRRHPEKDIVGFGGIEENRKRVADYHNRVTTDTGKFEN